MYSVLDFARMAGDESRTDAYARAIARVVKPGDVVVDIGAGTGILSLLAARAGAKTVHAIEPNAAIHLLRDLAKASGLAERIVIHPVPSFEVELTERADVVVCDLRGAFPLFGDALPAIRDARARFLRPGGALIAERDRLFVAFVESFPLWRRLEQGWRVLEQRGFSGDAVRTSVLNSVWHDASDPLAINDVLCPSAAWAEVDYASSEADLIEGKVASTVVRRGTVHGVAIWFEAIVHGDISYASGPGSRSVYANTFLPLSEPVPVEAGDEARITLRVDERGTRWAWDSEVRTRAAARSFRQTTFFGASADHATLLRCSMTHHPSRSPRGERMLRILEEMNGKHSVSNLVERAQGRLAAESPARRTVLDEVREAVTRYGV